MWLSCDNMFMFVCVTETPGVVDESSVRAYSGKNTTSCAPNLSHPLCSTSSIFSSRREHTILASEPGYIQRSFSSCHPLQVFSECKEHSNCRHRRSAQVRVNYRLYYMYTQCSTHQQVEIGLPLSAVTV